MILEIVVDKLQVTINGFVFHCNEYGGLIINTEKDIVDIREVDSTIQEFDRQVQKLANQTIIQRLYKSLVYSGARISRKQLIDSCGVNKLAIQPIMELLINFNVVYPYDGAWKVVLEKKHDLKKLLKYHEIPESQPAIKNKSANEIMQQMGISNIQDETQKPPVISAHQTRHKKKPPTSRHTSSRHIPNQ